MQGLQQLMTEAKNQKQLIPVNTRIDSMVALIFKRRLHGKEGTKPGLTRVIRYALGAWRNDIQEGKAETSIEETKRFQVEHLLAAEVDAVNLRSITLSEDMLADIELITAYLRSLPMPDRPVQQKGRAPFASSRRHAGSINRRMIIIMALARMAYKIKDVPPLLPEL
jgi:hypothetical protein